MPKSPNLPSPELRFPLSRPHIFIICAQLYIWVAQITGSTTFCLILCSTNLAGRAVRIIIGSVNLSTVLIVYHEFVEIFSKAKAETLASHYLYDLQIKLKNGEKLPIRTIYLLLTVEQEVLKKFICENLNMEFI